MKHSRFRRFWLALVGVAILALAPAGAATAAEDGLSAKQKEEVEQVIESYLLENPDVIMQALEILRTRQKMAEEERLQSVLTSRADEIFRNEKDPQTGAVDGDVVFVEFFDYQCPYCKRVMSTVFDIIKADGKVRMVFKEFPILGSTSIFAAKAALASARQGKYLEFHRVLMEAPGRLTNDIILSIARNIGIDTDRLKKDMNDPEIAEIIQRNYDLADALGINGTPAFVIGKTLVPGLVSRSELERLISEARAGS